MSEWQKHVAIPGWGDRTLFHQTADCSVFPWAVSSNGAQCCERCFEDERWVCGIAGLQCFRFCSESLFSENLKVSNRV